jgi:integrase/recombinase XerD
MEEFIYELKEKGRNNNTLNTYVFAFRYLKHYMIDRGIYNGFFEGFSSFKKVSPQIVILSQEEVERLIYADTTPKNYVGDKILKLQYAIQTFRMFLAYTGCSFDEADRLKVKFVDLPNGKILMKREKNQSIRHLYITEPLISRLKKIIKEKNNEELVFTNLRGNKFLATDFSKDLRNAAQSAGIKKRVHCHLLRHTYATYLYTATRDIKVVQEVLGHKDIKSTMIYVHIADEIIKEGMYRHPFVSGNINPREFINFVENTVRRFKLEEDKRFDYLKIKDAVHQFSSNLYQAILPSTVGLH